VKSFQNYRLDTINHCLWRGGERVRLAPRAFDILRFLVENSNSLISHDQLLDAIWPDTFVNPEILRKYVREIRRALGDSFRQPVFIETQPKRGYRFIANVKDLSASVSTGQICDCQTVDAKIEMLAAALGCALTAISDLQSAILKIGGLDAKDPTPRDMAASA
jgi:DNA-binding winged helix-turn-helix (wHTH) protein